MYLFQIAMRKNRFVVDRKMARDVCVLQGHSCLRSNPHLFLSNSQNLFVQFENVFVQFSKCICPNYKMHLSLYLKQLERTGLVSIVRCVRGTVVLDQIHSCLM